MFFGITQFFYPPYVFYYMKFPRLTVDGIIIKNKKIVLIKRRNEPFHGQWALPGGFVEYGETTEEAVIREIQEETGIRTTIQKILGVYSDPKRDPRGHTISIVYLLQSTRGHPQAGSDAEDIHFFNLNDLPPLAFDHKKIINDTIHQVKVT
jgi:8-oxo-dGTP diphosphatase